MTAIGYARVSTAAQDLTIQEGALLAAGVEPSLLYVETMSGARADRPELDHALKALRAGDVLVVTKLDRLARSLRHLLEVIDRVERVGASLRILDQALDTGTPTGRLVLHVLGAVAEMERELISERTRIALAARPPGKRGGRPRVLTDRAKRDVERRHEAGESVSDIARVHRVSRPTIYRALAEARTPAEPAA